MNIIFDFLRWSDHSCIIRDEYEKVEGSVGDAKQNN